MLKKFVFTKITAQQLTEAGKKMLEQLIGTQKHNMFELFRE